MMDIEFSTYTAIKHEWPIGLFPVFKSYLVFNGESYTSHVGKTKKEEAKHKVARTAIFSLLGIRLEKTYVNMITC